MSRIRNRSTVISGLALALAALLLPAVAGAGQWNAADEFSDQNPNGPWSYGYGTVGGDFTIYPNFNEDNVQWWRVDGWRSIYRNHTGGPVNMSGGLAPEPGALVMHPGDQADHLTKIRFTAPETAAYTFDITWTNIDVQAKKTWNWVYTNAASTEGTVYDFTPEGFKEIHTEGLTGHPDSKPFNATIEMLAGEIVSVEVGNGGDRYFDDSVQVSIEVSSTPTSTSASKTCGCYDLPELCGNIGGVAQAYASHGLYCVVDGQSADHVGTLSYRMQEFPQDCDMFGQKLNNNLGARIQELGLDSP